MSVFSILGRAARRVSGLGAPSVVAAGLLVLVVAAPVGARAWTQTSAPEAAQAEAPANTGEDEAEARIDRLEREVRELRALIEALAARPPAAGEAPPTPPAEAPVAKAEPPGETPAAAAPDLGELARRLDVLAAEIESLKLGEASAAEADRSERGMGPAASKVYRTGRGLSIGGYGEVLYENFASSRDDGADSGATDTFDALRAVLYAGFKFNDRFVFNSEIEFEHGSTEAGGEAALEFAYVDYLWRPGANFRAGLVLIPMGLVNELHEPTVFLGTRRPDVERFILPSTWRENGLGLYGDAGPWSYRTYVVNGFEAAGFSAEEGLREGKQDGAEAAADDLAWVGRLDWKGLPGLLVGGSLYAGDAGQGLATDAGRRLGVATRISELHLDWRWRSLQLRALAARAKVDQAAELNRALGLGGAEGVGEEMEGGYVELAYDVFARRAAGSERSLRPYLRWERYDTQAAVPAGFLRDPANDVESFTLGIAFQPIDELIFKADYQDYDNDAGTGVDRFNLAIGYVF